MTPTRGQLYWLQLLSRVDSRIWAERQADNTMRYEYRDLHGRIQPKVITETMVRMLAQAGWIERIPSNAERWTYRITTAGIEAAHGPP